MEIFSLICAFDLLNLAKILLDGRILLEYRLWSCQLDLLLSLFESLVIAELIQLTA